MTIFCGKGGTGKTSLSLALGICHAMRERSTVVVTSHPLAELAASISLAGLEETHPRAAENLFVVHLDPVEILNNTVRQSIPAGILVNAVLGSGIYQSLIEVAPGLKEIAFLSRLRKLAEEKTEGGRSFERVVWDAPATGHFLQMLRVSKNFATYLSGPFAVLGSQLARFTADQSQFSVVPVTTLEDMAIQETIEMCRQLENDLGVPTKSVICNMTSPMAASPRSAEELFGKPDGVVSDEVKFILERNSIEQSLFRELRNALTADLLPVTRKASWGTDLELLLYIARQLETLAETSA
jgi:anion-transporting  ArsA/GET3 family ATPase